MRDSVPSWRVVVQQIFALSVKVVVRSWGASALSLQMSWTLCVQPQWRSVRKQGYRTVVSAYRKHDADVDVEMQIVCTLSMHAWYMAV
jgi:hypothetical protein